KDARAARWALAPSRSPAGRRRWRRRGRPHAAANVGGFESLRLDGLVGLVSVHGVADHGAIMGQVLVTDIRGPGVLRLDGLVEGNRVAGLQCHRVLALEVVGGTSRGEQTG